MNSILKLGFISTKHPRGLSRFVSKFSNTNVMCRNYFLPRDVDVDLYLDHQLKLIKLREFRRYFKDTVRVMFKINNPDVGLGVQYHTHVHKEKVLKIIKLMYQCPPKGSRVWMVMETMKNRLGIQELPVVRLTSSVSGTPCVLRRKTPIDYEYLIIDIWHKVWVIEFYDFDDLAKQEKYNLLDQELAYELAESGCTGVCLDDGVSKMESFAGFQKCCPEDYIENDVCLSEDQVVE